ncbi:MAG: AzlD domain-containing protein [Spirochaetaceae bacterium]|jgi:branched-subunit amino acid transport protein AzlD|nr:AzlD domain-containing protein [Spirochaetaceae bacterium]
MIDTNTALIYTVIMALLIFLCRAFAFLFSGKLDVQKTNTIKTDTTNTNTTNTDTTHTDASKTTMQKVLSFVEKAAPPVAMCVLTFNAIALALREALIRTNFDILSILPTIAASLLTTLLYIWKRNPLIAIFPGVVVYMFLNRIL